MDRRTESDACEPTMQLHRLIKKVRTHLFFGLLTQTQNSHMGQSRARTTQHRSMQRPQVNKTGNHCLLVFNYLSAPPPTKI